MSKKITLLGSTGSIGTQSLDVIRAQGYEVFGLSAHSQTDKILQMDRAIAVSIGLLPLADFEAGRHQQSKTYKSKQSIY